MEKKHCKGVQMSFSLILRVLSTCCVTLASCVLLLIVCSPIEFVIKMREIKLRNKF